MVIPHLSNFDPCTRRALGSANREIPTRSHLAPGLSRATLATFVFTSRANRTDEISRSCIKHDDWPWDVLHNQNEEERAPLSDLKATELGAIGLA